MYFEVFILISLIGWVLFFLFKAKAKEKKEEKTGERDDTIPPEYRLTPELVSFSYLNCFVNSELCLMLYFITERERTHRKRAKLIFNCWLSAVGDNCIFPAAHSFSKSGVTGF